MRSVIVHDSAACSLINGRSNVCTCDAAPEWRAQQALAASPPSGSAPTGQGERDKDNGGENTAPGGKGRPAPTLHFVSGGSKEFLEDPTGDRRFWPVEVKASGLSAEGLEPHASSTTPGSLADDAPVPEPAD